MSNNSGRCYQSSEDNMLFLLGERKVSTELNILTIFQLDTVGDDLYVYVTNETPGVIFIPLNKNEEKLEETEI